MTLQSIADRVGVSRMTVSNAFSRPDQLSADLRAKILAAADELGYGGPDPAARALARGRTGSVGLLINGSLSGAFEDAVSAAFLASVSDALSERADWRSPPSPPRPTSRSCPPVTSRSTAPWSTSATPPHPTSPGSSGARSGRRRRPQRRRRRRLGERRRPQRRPPAAQHLVDLGHRRVGILTLETDPAAGNYPARERMLGWHDALDPAGAETVVVATPFARRGGVRRGARPARPPGPAHGGAVLLRRLRAGDDPGRRGPRSDGPRRPLGRRLRRQRAGRRLPAPLTTVHQEVPAKGRAAVAAIAEGDVRRAPCPRCCCRPRSSSGRAPRRHRPPELGSVLRPGARSGRDEEDLVAAVLHPGVRVGEVRLRQLDELVLVLGADHLTARAAQPGLHGATLGRVVACERPVRSPGRGVARCEPISRARPPGPRRPGGAPPRSRRGGCRTA